MKFVQARNEIVARLEAHLGCPVNLSDQIADKPEYPYCYYSVLTPRISNHAFGLREVVETDSGYVLQRSEPASATMSFTVCSMNRDTEDGYIYGEDEALKLAEKLHGFFLLDARSIHTDSGDIVIYKVGPVTNRTGFLVEDTVRRYGVDIRFNYVRTDEKPTEVIKNPGNPKGTPMNKEES